MLTASDLKIKLVQARRLVGEDKLQAYKLIYRGIYSIEKSACKDMGVSLNEILDARGMLGEVESKIRILEKQHRTRKAH